MKPNLQKAAGSTDAPRRSAASAQSGLGRRAQSNFRGTDTKSEARPASATGKRIVHVVEQRLSPRHGWHPWNVYVDRSDANWAMQNIQRANGVKDTETLFRLTKYESTEP